MSIIWNVTAALQLYLEAYGVVRRLSQKCFDAFRPYPSLSAIAGADIARTLIHICHHDDVTFQKEEPAHLPSCLTHESDIQTELEDGRASARP